MKIAMGDESDPLAHELRQQREQTRAALRPDEMRTLDAALDALAAAGASDAALGEGETAPEFDLPDANGHWLSLAELIHRRAAVVTFYRGAWCPYCNLTLRALERLRPRLRRAGVRVAAISPQPRAMALAQADRNLLELDLLHDAGNRVARLYGLVYEMPAAWKAYCRGRGIDVARLNGTEHWELPLAATYLIGVDGQVAYASVEIDHSRRFDPDALMRVLPAPAT
jgi:peroxiredoxin